MHTLLQRLHGLESFLGDYSSHILVPFWYVLEDAASQRICWILPRTRRVFGSLLVAILKLNFQILCKDFPQFMYARTDQLMSRNSGASKYIRDVAVFICLWFHFVIQPPPRPHLLPSLTQWFWSLFAIMRDKIEVFFSFSRITGKEMAYRPSSFNKVSDQYWNRSYPLIKSRNYPFLVSCPL